MSSLTSLSSFTKFPSVPSPAVGCHQRVKSELFLISKMLHKHLHDFDSQQASLQADEMVDAALAFACSIVHMWSVWIW